MIPFVRGALPAKLSASLADRTAQVRTAPGRARELWIASKSTRQHLKRHLSVACARPAFCMYCYESRGTDVDHFVPIARDPLLAFTWSNHLLTCGYCNQQAKQEHFPLDPAGHPLLLDPSVDDSAEHMTLSSSGKFIDLTPRGTATIEVLHLNARSELIDARFRSWRGILRIFEEAAPAGALSEDHLADLRFLPVVDVFHHFAHDVAARRLALKAVKPAVTAFAKGQIATLRAVFPTCGL